MHECLDCNYKSDNKSNFNKHLNSKYHKKKIERKLVKSKIDNRDIKKFICEYCDTSFSKAYNLTRHTKTCNQKDFKIRELKLTVQFLEKEVKMLKENNNNNNSVTNINNNKNIYISVMNFAQNNYSNAPQLLKFDNCDQIKEEDPDRNLVGALTYNYNNDCLHKYLGNFVIKNYKKDDPSQQSVWASDASRLNYIVKELMANKESIWINDPKGQRVKKYIIDPLLKYVDDECSKYIDKEDKRRKIWQEKVRKRLIDIDDKELKKMVENNIIITAITKIREEIGNNNLTDAIGKYIAPHLSMDKVKRIDNKNNKVVGIINDGQNDLVDDDSDNDIISDIED